jgi:hypothetical protein
MDSLDFSAGRPRGSLGVSAEDMWGDADTRQAKAVGAYFHEPPKVGPQFIEIDTRFLASLAYRGVEERQVGRIATSAR